MGRTAARSRERRGPEESRSPRSYHRRAREWGSRRGGYLERFARLQDPHVRSARVLEDKITKATDRVMRAHRHMPEGSPVVGNEMARAESAKQLEGILAGQMALPERAPLPPWRVT